jgi:peptide/nickel transport system substrate-binding protein
MAVRRFRVGWTVALIFMVVATACSSAGAPQGAGQESRREPTAPKTLTIGIAQEPTDFYGFAGSFGFGGVRQVPPIALDTLVVQNGKGEYQPLLAAEQISVERGTWKLNDDGTMDTIWKLRPNVVWHDGTPFTSEDMLFTLTVLQDRDTGRTVSGRSDLVQSASAPDPHTFIIRWSAPYADADQAPDLEPLPKHLLEDVYLNQKENFAKSPYLASQFIGQGPYKLAEWQSGSHMVFTRNDAYYQGRPPLDRVIVRFLGDPNTMVANILSENVDLLLPVGVGIDAAVEVQRRWAGTGNQVRFDLSDTIRRIEIQFRPEVVRPKDGLTDVRVRQALYHAIDRTTLAELFANGMAPIADSFVIPNSAMRAAIESSIPQYPYDPARAQQLLASAGWVRGGDGTLVNSATGDRFETELRVAQAEEQKLMSVVASQWKDVGAQVEEIVVPPARANDREYGSLYGGGLFSTGSLDILLSGRAHTRELRSAANRWTGRNRSGYSNPQLDALVDRAAVTITPAERTAVLGQLVQAYIGDVVEMPLFWSVHPVLYLKGVKAHSAVSSTTTWNFVEFDKE